MLVSCVTERGRSDHFSLFTIIIPVQLEREKSRSDSLPESKLPSSSTAYCALGNTVSNLGAVNLYNYLFADRWGLHLSSTMSNQIIFYDASIQSSVRSNKCYAPNTLYEYPQPTNTHN